MKKFWNKIKRVFVKQSESKVCQRCKQNLPLSMFGPHNKMPDKLQKWRRLCVLQYSRIYDKERRKAHKEEKQATPVVVETKQCKACKQILPIENFGINRPAKDGLQSYCKKCQIKYYNHVKKIEDRVKAEIAKKNEKPDNLFDESENSDKK